MCLSRWLILSCFQSSLLQVPNLKLQSLKLQVAGGCHVDQLPELDARRKRADSSLAPLGYRLL